MVTSGATPLEGLMGDTSCGDIDAGIIVTVAKEFNWGVEKINRMLSEESGLTGMAGHRVTIKDLFDSGFESGNPAREMFLYRLLQVCGSGIAAMGAIDSIVFSGRYRMAGKLIGPWLVKKLSFLKNTVPSVDLQWSIFPQTIEMLAGSYVGAVVAKVMV
jgi:acetate kinase